MLIKVSLDNSLCMEVTHHCTFTVLKESIVDYNNLQIQFGDNAGKSSTKAKHQIF